MPECNCIQIQKKWWGGNVFLAAVGYRYNVQMDLLQYEMADLQDWDVVAWSLLFFSRRTCPLFLSLAD